MVVLPRSTKSVLQLMGQGVIAIFKRWYLPITFRKAIQVMDDEGLTLSEFWKSYKIHNAIENIGAAWSEIKTSSINKVWKPLCPQLLETSETVADKTESEIRELLDLGNLRELNIEDEDIYQLLGSHAVELSNDDLMEMLSENEDSCEELELQ